ncbi:hypothetical protein OQA88_3437 [Cercophora sp. LCS_1]
MAHPTQEDIDNLARAGAGPNSEVPAILKSAQTRYMRIVLASIVQENAKKCRLCSICWNMLRKANNAEEPPVERDGKDTTFVMRIESFARALFPIAEGNITWNIPRLSIALTKSYEITGMIKQDGTILDTFPDAILRSIWRDQLDCLTPPQEEDAEKWEQLGKMDRIYGGAFMTLIAAGGCGVHAGLPGMGEHSRMHFQEQVFVPRKNGNNLTRDVVLMAALRPQNPANDHYLERTWWNTRGWCWQERVLSKRCLIFTDEQVYWECKKASFCEESHHDFMVYPVARNSREVALLPNNYEAQQKSFHTTDESPTILRRSLYESMSSHYPHSILRYSPRQLSREKDYLHALTGVLNSLTQSWGEEFFWGLPKSTFEQQLPWSGGGGGQRVAVHMCKDFTGSFWALPFPSWSWLSTKGHVWMPVSDGKDFFRVQAPVNSERSCAVLYDKHRPEVICYGFDPEGLSYDKNNGSWTVKDFAVRPMHSIRSMKPAWDGEVPPARLLPSPWRPTTRYWCKWAPGGELLESFSKPSDPAVITAVKEWEVTTSLALFQLDIDKQEGIEFKMGVMDGPQTLVFFWASSATLRVSWELRRPSEQFRFNPSDPRERHGFLQCPAILNAAGQPIGYLNPMEQALFEPYNGGNRPFEFVVIASYLGSKEDTRKLDVMMLVRQGLVKKRVTIGYVNEKDWVKAQRTWKLIALG